MSEPKVHINKVKRYGIDGWTMITFWDYNECFHVVLQHAWECENIHLIVDGREGRRDGFELMAIKAALHTAMTMREMSNETADKFVAATGYEDHD